MFFGYSTDMNPTKGDDKLYLQYHLFASVLTVNLLYSNTFLVLHTAATGKPVKNDLKSPCQVEHENSVSFSKLLCGDVGLTKRFSFYSIRAPTAVG